MEDTKNRPILVMNGTVAVLDPNVAKVVAEIEKQKKDVVEKEDAVKEAIKAAMIEQGVISIDTDMLKITYVAPTTAISFDSTKLKKEDPALWQKYSKTSKKSDSIRITLKDEEKGAEKPPVKTGDVDGDKAKIIEVKSTPVDFTF